MTAPLLRILLAALALLAPAAARAEWREAESNNFVVISEEPEPVLRARVEGLEKFGLVLQALTGARRLKEAPVKIRIYFVRDMRAVGATMPFGGDGVAGYYNATMRGPFAVMPRIDPGMGRGGLSSKTVLQHELTHHFMFQYFPAAYPSWYVEGMADYAGMIEIGEGDVTRLGLAFHNRGTCARYTWIKLDKLVKAKSYADLGDDMIALYCQGWLLTHYLQSSPEGKAKLGAYLSAINRGDSFEVAAKQLGDLTDLDKALNRYMWNKKLPATELRWEGLDPGPVKVRALSPAENALVAQDIALNAGIAKAKADAFAVTVRGIAKPFPNDPWALRILTEAERLAGNQAEAMAAADRWVAADPQSGLARMHKGQLEIAKLVEAKSTDRAAWTAARAHIIFATTATPHNPQILKAYYDSFAAQGRLPPVAAQDALLGAFDTLPQEEDLRFAVATDHEKRGEIADAIRVIRPLAYSIRSDDELSPRQKRRRDRARERYALAGDDGDSWQTAGEMLARLEKKAAEGTTTAAPR